MTKSLVACVVVLAATPVLAANLIVNGSFENPIVPAGSFINYLGGSTAITGWTIVGVDSSLVSGTFTQSGITFQAQDGNQWIDLAGVTSNSMTSGVTQNISTMIGQLYDVTFYVGSATDNSIFFPATVDLSIDGGARVHYTNPNAPTDMLNWQLFSVDFAATSSTTNLTFFNGDASNNYETPLDNVSVAVALPGDVNHDQVVNGLDISDVASHWLQTGIGVEGDANGDGVVNGLDIALISSNWLRTAGAATSVPEPPTFLLATIAGLAIVGGRRRLMREKWRALAANPSSA